MIEERTSPDGTTQWFLINHIPILDEAGAVTNLATIERDITERKLMEMRLRRADKMQALGTLAGGVAHDFNNLLMAVLGSLDLASRRAPDDPRLTAAPAECHLCGGARCLPDATSPELQPPARPAAAGRGHPGHHRHERPADAHARRRHPDRAAS